MDKLYNYIDTIAIHFHSCRTQSLYIILLIFLISSCTGLGKLSDGQKIVTNNTIRIDDKENLENHRKVINELKNELTPKPNGKFLWMRPRLVIYNSVDKLQKEKGFKHWLKHKLGQSPALYDEEVCPKLKLTIENRLYHQGSFNAHAYYNIQEKKKTVQIEYIVQSKAGYAIDTIIFPEPKDHITTAIHQSQSESLITRGATYSLEMLKEERKRIDIALENQGFYYFDPDYLLFKADSSQESNRVKLKLVLKEDNPSESAEVYTLNNIYIAEDFRLKNYHPDTSSFETYTILSAKNYMKTNVLINSVFLQKDSIYSKNDHNNTLRQLMGTGAYRYVNVNYAESPDKTNALDALMTLTPSQKMSVSSELNATSKSNDFAGPGMKLSFKSRNFLRGAELFSINLRGRFEKQINGEKESDTAYELSVDASLDLPRIIPFKTKKISRPFSPFTSISIGTGIYARLSYYKFHTFNTGLEYTWRKNKYLTHKFMPINISLTDLLEATDEFKAYLLLNPSIRTSFEEQFIIGAAYTFIYNHLTDPKERQYYFSFSADPSGNLVGLLNTITSKESTSPDNPATVFGIPVSQYFRFRIDTRYYFKTGKEALIATRIHGGVGLPFGNSTVMPYVKQFYSGGTNSIRAFRARTLGPGTYYPPDSLENVLIDQTGEIKIEANVEYRFPIVRYLKGALFTDFGNIWLAHEDSLRPGGKFDVDTFYKELAVGVGFGLRIDVDIVVLRFDWAFPVRKPWLPEGERWVFNEIDLFDKQWRKDNLLWNISIGYPF